MNMKSPFSASSEINIFAVMHEHQINIQLFFKWNKHLYSNMLTWYLQSKANFNKKKNRTLFHTPKQKQHEKFGVLSTKFTEDQKYLTHFFHQGFQILRERRNVLGMGKNNSHFFLPAYFFKHLCSFLWSLHGNWFNSALNNKVNNLW